MSLTQNLAEALRQVETELEDNTFINDPANYDKLTGCADFLFNPQYNPRTIKTEFLSQSRDGKIRPVDIRYLPKKGDDDVYEADTSFTCNTTPMRRELRNTYNPTLFVADKFTIEEEVIREGTLKDITQRMSIEMRDAQRNGRERMDKKLYTTMTNNVGANPAASERTGLSVGKGTYSDLELLNADGTVGAQNFDVIKIDQQDNYMTGDAAIIGLGNARKFQNRLAVGNVNDGGVDIRQVDTQFGMTLFLDHFTNEIQSSVNKDRVLVCYPGLQQFYNYNIYANSTLVNSLPDLTFKGTVQDSVYPFMWDFHLKYHDGCDDNSLHGAWVGTIFSYFDLWIVPEEAFGEGYTNNLTDFNGIVGYNITQAS